MTTTTLPITIHIEVTGTFIPGNLHKVRDEEPQGDTFEDRRVSMVILGDDPADPNFATGTITQEFLDDIGHYYSDEIIEALLTEHSKSAP